MTDVLSTEQFPSRQAGLKGLLPQRPEGDRFAIEWSEHYSGPAPEPVYPIDVTGGAVISWQMLGNGPDPTLTVNNGQPVGDCFFAGRGHAVILAITLGKLNEADPTADQTVTLYLTYDKGQDVGVVLADALLWLYQKGYILAFAPVALDRMDAVMSQTGRGLLTGENLTDDAQQRFEATPPQTWSVSAGQTPDTSEGHCTFRIKKQSATGNGTLVTWAAEQEFEDGWEKACVTEAWIEYSAEDKASMAPAKWAELVGALDALPGAHGIEVPAPAPSPTPPPMPVPGPVPEPTPAPPSGLLQHIEELAKEEIARLEADIQKIKDWVASLGGRV
jgi:hypothetical protein